MPSIADHTPGRYPGYIPGLFPDIYPDRCADRFSDPFPSCPTTRSCTVVRFVRPSSPATRSCTVLPFRPVNQMAFHLPVLYSTRGKQTGTVSHAVPLPSAGETDPSRTLRCLSTQCARGYFVRYDNRIPVRVPRLECFICFPGEFANPVTGACLVTKDLIVRIHVKTTTTILDVLTFFNVK